MNVGVGNFRECLKDGKEVSAFVAAECSGNIFLDNESWIFPIRCSSHFLDDARHFEEQVAALSVVQTSLLTRH